MCYVRQCQGWEVDPQHLFDQCPDELYKIVVDEVKQLERVRFEWFASCTHCKVA